MSSSSSSPNCVRNLSSSLEAIALVKDDATSTHSIQLSLVRDALFELSATVGQLSTLFVEFHKNKNKTAVTKIVVQLFKQLWQLCHQWLAQPSLYDCCMAKMDLNEKKYPVHLCQGKSNKYTDYSADTGISKTVGQVLTTTTTTTTSTNASKYPDDNFVRHHLPALLQRSRQFAVARQWLRYHQPRNLLLALIGELGELCELFQWKGDDHTGTVLLSDGEMDAIRQEVADVTIYLLRLADMCEIDLGAAMRKEAV